MDIDRLRSILEADHDVLALVQKEYSQSLREIVHSNPPSITSAIILPEICRSQCPALFPLLLSWIFDPTAIRHSLWFHQGQKETFENWVNEIICVCVFQENESHLLNFLTSPQFEKFKTVSVVSNALGSCARYHFHRCLHHLLNIAPHFCADEVVSIVLGGKNGSPSLLSKDFSKLLPTLRCVLDMLPRSSEVPSLFAHPLFLISSPEYPRDTQKIAGEMLVDFGWSVNDEVSHPMGGVQSKNDLSRKISQRSPELHHHLSQYEDASRQAAQLKEVLEASILPNALGDGDGVRRKI